MTWCGSLINKVLYFRSINLYILLKCFLPECDMIPPTMSYIGGNDSSSDTEDYHETDERRRRVFKNRLRYKCILLLL